MLRRPRHRHLDLHLSRSLADRWGTPGDFTNQLPPLHAVLSQAPTRVATAQSYANYVQTHRAHITCNMSCENSSPNRGSNPHSSIAGKADVLTTTPCVDISQMGRGGGRGETSSKNCRNCRAADTMLLSQDRLVGPVARRPPRGQQTGVQSSLCAWGLAHGGQSA